MITKTKDVYWYYKEMDKTEAEIKNCQDEALKEKLEKYMDQLHDEFFELED